MIRWNPEYNDPERKGDPVLAEQMRRLKVKAPVERITRTDLLATAMNREKLGRDIRKRIVDLECGHQTVTRNKDRAPCPECHRMIMNGEDYDAFRNRNKEDQTDG